MQPHSLISKPKGGQRRPAFLWRSFPMTLFGSIILSSFLCLAAAASMCGSGFVIRQDGYILTNYHVIKNANQITVTVPGRQAVPARVVTVDQEKDLAILQVSLRNITALPIASSETVQVLDTVTVLGYPLPTELGTALSASGAATNGIGALPLSQRFRR
jgi:S1-C subfamily serine protease